MIQLRFPLASTPSPGTKTSSWNSTAADQGRPRRALPEPDRQAARDEHQRDADHREHGLLDDRLVGRFAGGRRRGGGRRQHHDQAEAGQQQGGRCDQQEFARHGREHPAQRDAGGQSARAQADQPRSWGGRVLGGVCVVVATGPPRTSLSHRIGEAPAAVGVGGELVEGCRGGGEQYDVPVTRDPGRQFDDPCHDLFSLIGLDLEHRHRGRVSRERREHRLAVDADDDRRLRARPASGHQFGDVHALEQTADDPDGARVGGERGCRGVRIGRLGVIDPGDAVDDLDHLDAVRVEPEAAQGVSDGGRRDLQRPGERRRREDVRDHVRGGEALLGQVGDGGQLQRARATVLEERPIDQDAVDHAQVARPGHTQVESDGTGALDDLGVLDHARGGGIRLVVDARDAGAVVHVRLRVAVRLERAVPFEVIVGEVQADARVR